MDIDLEERQAAEQRKVLVDQLEQLIRNTIPKDQDVIGQPAVIAALLERFGHDKRDFHSFTFEAVIGHCVGSAIMQEIDALLALADKLHAGGYTEEKQYSFGYADRYAFSLLHAEKQKVFALRTQNVNYLVVLTKRWAGWEVHLRQWWETFSLDGYVPYDIEPFAKGQPLTLADAQRLANRFAEFADDLPGVSYPERLSLKAFKDTGFKVDKNDSCAGLRYGDARDRGYIATVKTSVFGIAEADKMSWHALSRLHYVWYDLLSAIDTLGNGENESDED